MTYAIATLEASTWDRFAELVERNNGIYGGCWCISFHTDRGDPGLDHRAAKEQLVRTDRAHAALVLDQDGVARGPGRVGRRVGPDRERGGGLVEAISEVTDGRVAQSRFLYSGTVELLEQYDFVRVRQVGKHAWIMHRDVPPA